jgi:septal ring factor EnvC (AmiA/AmiB activator)
MDMNDFKLLMDKGFEQVDSKIDGLAKSITETLFQMKEDFKRQRDNSDTLFNMDRQMRDKVANLEKEMAEKNAQQDATIARQSEKIETLENESKSKDQKGQFSIQSWIAVAGVVVLIIIEVIKGWRS